MVKGVSRRVVVVDRPDPRYFEQAIFVLRADAPPETHADSYAVREACRIAGNYLRRCGAGHRLPPLLRRLLWFASGAGAALALCYLLSALV